MEIQFSNFEEFKTEIVKALSTNGYFIKIDEDIPVRSHLTISFSIKGEDRKLEVRCEVVYVGNGGVGVTFTENLDSLKEKFAQFAAPTQTAKDTQPDPSPQNVDTQSAIEEKRETDDDDLEDGEAQVVSETIQQSAPLKPEAPPDQVIKTIKGKIINTLKLDSSKKAGEKDILSDFGDLSLTKILLNIYEGKTSGIIKIKSKELEKIVYFKKGRPVFVESNPPLLEESIGQILVEKDKIKKEDLENAVKYVEEHGCRIGEAMMKLKQVSPTLLRDALTFQLKLKLFELFKWKEADFEMDMLTSMTQKFGTRPLNVINTIYKGLKDKLKEQYPQELEQYISPIYDKYLTQKDNPLFDIESLGFSNQEKRFWDLMLTGKRRVRQIFEGSTMNKPDTFRFLYALLELDLVNINDHQTLDIPNIERDIYNQLRFMEKMNYFELLQVHWSSNQEKIKENFERHSGLLEEQKKTHNITQETKDNIDRMLALLKKAYKELSDNSKKREYRKEIIGESEAKIAAELAARQSQLAEFKNDMKEARHLIEVALDLAPGNMEYRALYKKYGGKRK